MDCPYCGKPLKEGRVFCETCGKEIQIVPVFEPEIEEHMKNSLSDVVELFKDQKDGDESKRSVFVDERPIGKFNYLFAAGAIMLAVVILCLVFIVKRISEYNSYDYQMQMADKYYQGEDYEKAQRYAERANIIAPNSSDAKMLLASCFHEMGVDETAQELLLELLDNDSSYANAYKLLIALYESRQEYKEINELLATCEDTSVVDEFLRYQALMPQFSDEEGIYDSVLSLKILSTGSGSVHYTMDGSVPDESSQEYLGPIRLEDGKYQIQAVYINEYGVSSDVASGTYIIDIAAPDEPEVNVESGTYHAPQMIETFLGNDFEIYYTTDGSEPDRNSNPYLVPIPMPLGRSVFKFIMYNDEGVASPVAVREYNLQIDTALSTDLALLILKQALIGTGSIADMYGQIPGSGAHKEFELKSAFAENDQIFYLITEYMVEADQSRSKTGNQYAVNVATNELYRASTNYAGYYVVEAFE